MNRENRLDLLINRLKNENTEYANLPIPDNIKDKQKLLRALMNVRPPHPIADEWLTLQDEELQEQLDEKGVVDIDTLPRKGKYILWQGDITRLNADAIVNAANEKLYCLKLSYPNPNLPPRPQDNG